MKDTSRLALNPHTILDVVVMKQTATNGKRKTISLSVSLSKAQAREVRQVAVDEDLKVTQVIRRAIVAYLACRAPPGAAAEAAADLAQS